MSTETAPTALKEPSNGFLTSVVANYQCVVCRQEYALDVVFDVAPPRNLPHPDCPGTRPVKNEA